MCQKCGDEMMNESLKQDDIIKTVDALPGVEQQIADRLKVSQACVVHAMGVAYYALLITQKNLGFITAEQMIEMDDRNRHRAEELSTKAVKVAKLLGSKLDEMDPREAVRLIKEIFTDTVH